MGDIMYDFTEVEIREQLEKFGFQHIPDDKLHEFKKDLDILIRAERRKLTEEARQNMSYTSGSTDSPDEYDRGVYEHHYPYRPEAQRQPPRPSDRSDRSDNAVAIHVTGIDPSMRKVHATATYVEGDERLTRSAPTSPSKSIASITDSESEKRIIKRKVLRKVNGEKVIDESFIESESDNSSIFRERVRPRTAPTEPLSSIENRAYARPVSAVVAPPARVYFEEPYMKSVIYPMAEPPHTKNVRRCDVVNRFHEFKQYWDARKTPGETSHKSLRWGVRENMIYHDPIVKKTQQHLVPNKYVIPTENKRLALRWQVRAQMAEGRLPTTGYYSN